MAQAKRKERADDSAEADVAEPALAVEAAGPSVVPAVVATPWAPPAALSRLSLGVLAAVVLLVNLPLLHYYLLRGEAEASVGVPYTQDFTDPTVVARDFWSSGGQWRVEGGQLLSPGVKNNPLWLKAKLPANVAVEFDARSMSQEGDLKVEIFGDGYDHASGYILIHGGWNNQLSIIARLDEHGRSLQQLTMQAQQRAQELRLPSADLVQTGIFKSDTRMRVEANPYRVEPGRTYRWRIERRGGTITWLIDGQKFMEFTDPFPLQGKGHDRLGFSSWESQLYFDNLRIEPL